MKKLYLALTSAAMLVFVSSAFSQVQQIQEVSEKLSQFPNAGKPIKSNPDSHKKSGVGLETYWTEDFSNGFNGQDDNGEWTLEGQELWFYTFPEELPDGYDSEAPLTTTDEYGDFLPNWFVDREVVMSATRDNGVMMVDADRYNSTALASDDDPGSNTTSNPLTAYLVSPQIDLTGVNFANIQFTQFLRLCCLNASFVTVDFSVDDGEFWVPFDAFSDYGVVNQDIEGDVIFNISTILQQAEDLSECRIRFNFSGDPTHYFWMVDDISIVALPENELVAGKTFYNNHHSKLAGYNAGTIGTEEYYHSFELHSNPVDINRIYNFGMVVSNEGTEAQTNVTLEVTLTDPFGDVTTYSSEGITLEAGTTDTITIDNIDLFDLDLLMEGLYTIDYEVTQAETDEGPENNVGNTREFTITDDCFGSGENGGVIWNGDNRYNGTYSTLGDDVIWSTPHIFTDPDFQGSGRLITHVQAAFLFAPGFAETIVGEIIYFNVRKGHVFDEDPEDPDTQTTVFFDPENPLEYDASELEYEIQEEDLWDSGEGGDYVFATFELPFAILVEEDVVYCAEYRVPPAGSGIVYPPITLGQEIYSGLLYDFADGSWFHLGENTINTRFLTCFVENTDDVTYEDGLVLNQNFPNPATEMTRIQFKTETSDELTFQVHDIAGKLVYSEYLGTVAAQNVIEYMYDVSDLAPGVYSYSILTDNTQVTRKMIVE